MNSAKTDPFNLEAAVAAAERTRSRGDIEGTYVAYQRIAAKRLGANYRAADLGVLHSLADLAALCGHHQAADDVLVAITNLCRLSKRLHRADFAVLNRIHLALDQGHVRQAMSLFQEMAPSIGDIQAIEINARGLMAWEARCHWPDANKADRMVMLSLLYLEGGRLLSALGQYGDALEMFNRGLSHATPKETQSTHFLAQRQVPWFHLAIAWACLESGLLPEAQATLIALERQPAFLKEQSLQIQWHTVAGKLALLQGHLGKALEHFQTILKRCHTLKIQRSIAIATLNLAQALIVLNQNQLAKEHLSSVSLTINRLQDKKRISTRLTILKQLAEARSQSLVPGTALLSISDLKQKTLPLKIDLAKQDETLRFSRAQSAHYLTSFEDRLLEFQWYLSRAELTKAAQLLNHIQTVVADTDSQLIQTKLRALQGILFYYEGAYELQNGNKHRGLQQIRKAAVTIDSARPALAKMGLKPDQWQAQRVLGWCLMRLQGPPAEQNLLATETTKLLEALTESLAAEQQAIFLLNKWTAEEEYLATQIVRIRKLKESLKVSPWHQRPQKWWQLQQHLNTLINHIDGYRKTLANRTTQANKSTEFTKYPSLLSRLLTAPWRRATLSFLVLPDQILVIRSWFLWLDFAVVPLTRLELRNLVEKYYEMSGKKNRLRTISLAPDLNETQNSQPGTQKEAFAKIITEKLTLSSLLNLPWYIHRLTIIPDDVLHIFPFAAIKHKGRYLIESYPLTVAYEMSKSSACQASPRRRQRISTQALLVGVSQGSAQFSSLPGVRREVESIFASLIKKKITIGTLLDREVEKEHLLLALKSTSLLHIACHGVFKHSQADKSGLVLAPQSTPPSILSLREIAALDLTELEHITLSACSSADHLVMPGRWVVSLPETLWRAGTNSVLGSLWEVYDQFAITFMTTFYKYLHTMPRDEALRETQLDCLHGHLPTPSQMDSRDPIYWAGFNLYGDSRRVKFTTFFSSIVPTSGR